MSDIVLKRQDADRMLKESRRRIVTSETEVAMAKLVYDARFNEYWEADQARVAFQSAHPWLIDETEPVPDELRDTGEDNNLQPKYIGIQMRWRGLCERCDRISDQLQSAPAVIQSAMNKQAEFDIKNGQMISAASAFSALIDAAGAGSRFIEDARMRDQFLVEIQKIRARLIDANPHLGVQSTGY